jgi:predicted MPP superfamily phosphohydrolase
VFHLYTTVACVYVLIRFVYPLRLPAGWRWLIALVLIVASKYHLLIQLFSANMYSPEMPYLLVYGASWAFSAFALLFVLTLAADLCLSVAFLLRRRAVSGKVLMQLPCFLAGAAVLISGYGVAQATRVPDVRRVELEIQNLPAQMEGFRIVQLSDLHISRLFPRHWVEEVIARTNALSPDLIVITGDLIDGTQEARRDDVKPLADLSALNGVIAIPGNHEYYFGSDQWMSTFRSLGMSMLLNQHVELSDARGRLVIAGITDKVAPNYGGVSPDLNAALKGRPSDVPVILLNHRPDTAHESANEGVDVQLSGHTHGGMIRGFDRVVAAANQGYVSGMYNVAGMQLYVSNGTGLWNGFPIRLGVASEITEFVLRPAPH